MRFIKKFIDRNSLSQDDRYTIQDMFTFYIEDRLPKTGIFKEYPFSEVDDLSEDFLSINPNFYYFVTSERDPRNTYYREDSQIIFVFTPAIEKFSELMQKFSKRLDAIGFKVITKYTTNRHSSYVNGSEYVVHECEIYVKKK